MLHLRPTSFPQRRLSGRETCAAAVPVVAVCDGGIGAERRQQAPQRLFAFQERRAHQVAAVEIRKVEGLESQTVRGTRAQRLLEQPRSEEHTSELQSLMRKSYAVFCLKKKKNNVT